MNDLLRCSLLLLLTTTGCRCTAVAGGESSLIDGGCQPATCTALNATCGVVEDGCGGKLKCGVCAEGSVCGGAGVASVCSPVCTDGWCWQHPLPQGNSLNDVWRSPSGELWVVGFEGTLLRHDGEQWHRMPSPAPAAALMTVWGTADDDVWVGGNGAWHWDGSRWTAAPVPKSFVGRIRGSSSTDVWGVGAQSMFHWDGHGWTESANQSTSFSSIWVNAPNDVWVAGDFGVVRRWNGVQWTSMTGVPASHHLRGIGGTSASDVWVVGLQTDAAGLATSLVEHWDGAQWTVVLTPGWPTTNTTEYRSVLALSAADVWVVGDEGTVLQWDGLLWRPVPTGTDAWLKQVIGIDRNHVWVVGDGGTLLQWTSGAWRFLGGSGAAWLSAFWASSTSDAWAAGYDGYAAHFDGSEWISALGLNQPRPDRGTPGTLPGLSHYALWGSGRDDVWCADRVNTGPAQLQHFDGVSWLPAKIGSVAAPFAIRAGCSLSPTDAWAVGTTVLHLNGSWSELPGPWPGLTDVSCPSATDVWTVGSTATAPMQGQVLHWDGSVFTTVFSPSSATLEHVWARNSNDVWVTGTTLTGVGLIFHWDGSAWTERDWQGAVASSDLNDRNAQLTSITGNGGEVWVATNVGFLLHWDGQRWARVATGKHGFLSHVWRSTPGAMWLTGDFGAILHHD